MGKVWNSLERGYKGKGQLGEAFKYEKAYDSRAAQFLRSSAFFLENFPRAIFPRILASFNLDSWSFASIWALRDRKAFIPSKVLVAISLPRSPRNKSISVNQIHLPFEVCWKEKSTLTRSNWMKTTRRLSANICIEKAIDGFELKIKNMKRKLRQCVVWGKSKK